LYWGKLVKKGFSEHGRTGRIGGVEIRGNMGVAEEDWCGGVSGPREKRPQPCRKNGGGERKKAQKRLRANP